MMIVRKGNRRIAGTARQSKARTGNYGAWQHYINGGLFVVALPDFGRKIRLQAGQVLDFCETPCLEGTAGQALQDIRRI
ncbi:hypothetical protein [Collimonas sp. OK242]|jgi:hypothetical protein|uniref:hypothetical protein n=1 Tax=Collimonas sp. OK242 TaxID=1798195 RepID=UPI000B86C474|nr:hypothetical protein [Collimonas sp. OK242]